MAKTLPTLMVFGALLAAGLLACSIGTEPNRHAPATASVASTQQEQRGSESRPHHSTQGYTLMQSSGPEQNHAPTRSLGPVPGLSSTQNISPAQGDHPVHSRHLAQVDTPMQDRDPAQRSGPVVDTRPRDVSHLLMLHPRITGAAFDYDLPDVERAMEAGWHGAEASPTHIVIKGTPVAEATRCAWRGTAMTNSQRHDAIRFMMGVDQNTAIPERSVLKGIFDAYVQRMAAPYTDAMEQNLYHLMDGGTLTEGQVLVCYVDFAVNEYILGAGPARVTVGYDDIAKTRSYGLYKLAHAAGRYGDQPLLSQSDYAADTDKTLSDAEKGFASNLENRESVAFLTPMGAHSNIAVEVWQVIAQWDLQTVDGTLNAVRYGTSADDYAHSQTLAALKARISAAAKTDAVAGKRIANVSGLNQYYRDIGAYADITPNDSSSDTFTPDRPPRLPVRCSNGVVVPSPESNPGLVKDCEALAHIRDALDRTGVLNWSGDRALTAWQGLVFTQDGTKRVQFLRLSDMELTGTLPAALADLDQLHSMALGGNNITGVIPPELGVMKRLAFLNLSDNQLSGSIPAELGNMTSLTKLMLAKNDLTGTIPVELGSLSNLSILSLWDNQLTGTIPVELGVLGKLTQLRLFDNQLSGGVPSELGNLSNLEDLILRENQLTGTIPSTLGNLSKLEQLWLDDNQLSGTIPTQLGSLSNMTDLVLGDNQLTGAIPSQLGNMTALTYLDLINNDLSGSIPATLGNFRNLEAFRLMNNDLTGSLPVTLANLTELEEFYVGGNTISGCIPAALFRVPNNDLSTLKLPTCPTS